MNKKFLKIAISTLVTASVIITAGVIYFNGTKPTENSLGTSNIPVSIQNIDTTEQLSDIDASYGDGSSTVDEMKQKAKQIVTGTVVSQKQFSPITVVSTVKVKDTYRGKKFDEIEICQLGTIGGEEVLSSGKEYTLFLGLQGKADENKFYIVGGLQGIFFKAKDSDTIEACDPTMEKDFDLKKKENVKINSQDGFIDYIKK